VVQRAGVPVIVLNLQPAAASDYAAFNRMGNCTRMTGEWLANCTACPVPEIANVFSRPGIQFHQITGMLQDDPIVDQEIHAWIDASRVADILFHNRLGFMGHDGPGHIAIAEGKTKVRPLHVYHGKVGRGLSVEMSVRHGPVTLLSVVQTADGRLKLIIAEAESVPGPILEIGNTNSRYRFKIGPRSFVTNWNAQGPAHHCAVGIGHIANKLHKLGALLNIETTQIC
jgi:L-arabinose isomerase